MNCCRLCGSYHRDHEHKRLLKHFPWLTSEKVYLPLYRLSNTVITCGLNNAGSKNGVVNMSTPTETATLFPDQV